jgi:hypothetical protein
MSSHAGDGATGVTWPRRDVDAESCWRRCCQVMLVTPWRYCSSYYISTVASIVLSRCLLQYKLNSRKMMFSINEVGSFEVNWKVGIFQTPVLCGPLSLV